MSVPLERAALACVLESCLKQYAASFPSQLQTLPATPGYSVKVPACKTKAMGPYSFVKPTSPADHCSHGRSGGYYHKSCSKLCDTYLESVTSRFSLNIKTFHSLPASRPCRA